MTQPISGGTPVEHTLRDFPRDFPSKVIINTVTAVGPSSTIDKCRESGIVRAVGAQSTAAQR